MVIRSSPADRRLRVPRKRLLFVTGGTGFLGRHIVNGPSTASWDIVAPGSAGLDLRFRDSVLSVIGDWKPTAIIHTAYRKGDRAAIVDASANVAEAAAATGARLVHISTDAVFGGRLTPYTELDLPDPIHEYGVDKTDAEQVVAEICPGAAIVRTSLLIGRSVESAHELAVREAIENRSPMTFFTDEVRCPGLVDDVAAAVTNLADEPGFAGLIHLAGPDAISRAELALMIARRHNLDAAALKLGPMGDARMMRPDHLVLDSSEARSMGIGIRGPATAW